MSKTQRIVALLPMKGHSERVANKNFRLFAGKPLYQWILDALLAVAEIAEVVINTDARAAFEADGIGARNRVRIRDRTPDLCGDTVSMNRILRDDIQHIPADAYVMTHATNPLLEAATIREAVASFFARSAAGEIDSLFTVNRTQTRFYGADGRAINHDPTNLIRTQDLEPWFEENSNLYVFTASSFAATDARIGRRPGMFATPRMQSLDIDDEEGWQLAEAVARGRRAST